MKKTVLPTLFLLVSISLSSCSAIEGIFKAGAFVGILAVVVVIAIIIWVISLIRGRNS
ncbi:phosphatidate cytidylyltransferase [Pedobacter sp. HMF7647]|uniref:Phosphatidate cytidylyltransferase n=1 Tax=Hufsiella arboris TaxID=2695275 RepID=A0A7K1Y8P7_9SPHI|nr:phosphatidate cytidylyltransferase [Hufsiella arboris]MXV50418.1 phosphatidate cytidylyltransferase [Hufsiella arboris]